MSSISRGNGSPASHRRSASDSQLHAVTNQSLMVRAPAVRQPHDGNHEASSEPSQDEDNLVDPFVTYEKMRCNAYFENRLDTLCDRIREKYNLGGRVFDKKMLLDVKNAFKEVVTCFQDEYVNQIKYMVPSEIKKEILSVLEHRKKLFPKIAPHDLIPDSHLHQMERIELDKLLASSDYGREGNQEQRNILRYIHENEAIFLSSFIQLEEIEEKQFSVGCAHYLTEKIMKDNYYDGDKKEYSSIALDKKFFDVFRGLLSSATSSQHFDVKAVIALKCLCDLVGGVIEDQKVSDNSALELQHKLSGTYTILTSIKNLEQERDIEETGEKLLGFFRNTAQIFSLMREEILDVSHEKTAQEKSSIFINKLLLCAKEASLPSLRR